MEQIQNNTKAFSSQKFIVGIDVHKKNWKVTIRTNQMELKTLSMNPSPSELGNYLRNKYPGGEYHSVYEAGYSGYWIDEELKRNGIENIIVNPADVPTTNKEKLTKTDKIDSRKLARELENRTLTGIYVPNKYQQELRSLCRLRYTLVKDQARMKNRIKGYLLFYGKEMPENNECSHWSGRFIKHLRGVEFSYNTGKDTFNFMIDELEELRKKIVIVTKKLREVINTEDDKGIVRKLYTTVPGVGYVTAITLYTEIMDMRRFSTTEKLASYIGLVPSINASGERESVLGLTVRNSKYLRYLLVEAAWTAVRKDEALLQYFNELSKRMKKTRAIISVAKKLLSRIRHVWLKNEEYVCGVIR